MGMEQFIATRMLGERLEQVLRAAGGYVRMDGGRMVRVDAAVATAFAARELEYVKAQTYDIKKVALQARTFIPVSTEAPPGSEFISYDQWDTFGEAEIADAYSKDSPRVDGEKRNVPTKVFGLRASYGFSVQDFRAIAMSGSRLDLARAMQARRAIENALEKIAAVGVAHKGTTGLANNANVPLFGTALAWDFTTPSATIYRQLNAIAAAVIVNSKQVERPDTLLMPTKAFQIASQVPFGNDANPKSVLQAFLENSPYIRRVDQWVQLDGAGAGGTDRLVCYRYDPSVVQIEISQDYEEFPPEIRGLMFLTECHLRTAGTVIRYPLAMEYADGTFDTSSI